MSDQHEMDIKPTESVAEQMSHISFENLQKLQHKIGSKKYTKDILGATSNVKKRDNPLNNSFKDGPVEMSSKKRPVHINYINKTNSLTPRDPRFDSLCGTYNDKQFKANYKFIKTVKEKERKQLAEQYKNEDNPDKQQTIKHLMQRIDNQLREQDKLDKKRKIECEQRNAVRKTLMQGQKPIFKKKSEKRMEDLVRKYQELKETNRLKKHLATCSKKMNKRP